MAESPCQNTLVIEFDEGHESRKKVVMNPA
jgi:hypothetical protein